MHLNEVPNAQPNPEVVEELRAQRNAIMKGEVTYLWCLQEGDCIESRQFIRNWVFRPIELALLNVSEELGK